MIAHEIGILQQAAYSFRVIAIIRVWFRFTAALFPASLRTPHSWTDRGRTLPGISSRLRTCCPWRISALWWRIKQWLTSYHQHNYKHYHQHAVAYPGFSEGGQMRGSGGRKSPSGAWGGAPTAGAFLLFNVKFWALWSTTSLKFECSLCVL